MLTTSAAVSVDGCSKRIGSPRARRTVLDRVSLTVATGELVVLLGDNGAGKTTLLKMICGLAAADEGTIRRRSPVIYCGGGERSFYFRLSVYENLHFFAALAGLHGRERRKKIDEVLGILDLSGVVKQRFAELSSGMRGRLAIARALLHDPDILAFDEPTRAVDPKHAAQLRTFIRSELVERLGKTVLLATNLLDEARELADRIVLVHNASLRIVEGVPDDLAVWIEQAQASTHEAAPHV